jgi:hypothetical protein
LFALDTPDDLGAAAAEYLFGCREETLLDIVEADYAGKVGNGYLRRRGYTDLIAHA